mgnify:CR=1 FL=1
MRRVRPQGPIDFTRLALTPEEGFVLSRVDGPTTTRDLVALTGLDEARIDAIVDKLSELGVVDSEPNASVAPPRRTSELPEAEEATDEPVPDAPTEDELLEASSDEDEADPAGAEAAERNYRQIYEWTFREMSTDERVVHAERAQGPDLFALCLDPDPRVIFALLKNATFGLDHARYVVLWHRTPQGLDHVARDVAFLRDRQVERRLLRNPQISEPLLLKLLSPKRLVDVYKTCIDREIQERTRQKARSVLHRRWASAAPEERVELLLSTEARCLTLLTGCTIDARSVQILCGRSSFTTMFITSMARFSAAPPALLAHLSKLPLVRKNPQLRRMLQAHKNMPGDAKRSL